MPKKYPLKKFRHQIEICDNVSKSVSGGTEKQNRIPLHENLIWAIIEQSNPYKINSFRANTEDRENATHIIVIKEQCAFEVNPKHWIYRSHKDRDEWFKVLAVSDYEEGFECYTRILASLRVRDSQKLDPDTQDIPCEDIEPDNSVYFNLRDAM